MSPVSFSVHKRPISAQTVLIGIVDIDAVRGFEIKLNGLIVQAADGSFLFPIEIGHPLTFGHLSSLGVNGNI